MRRWALALVLTACTGSGDRDAGARDVGNDAYAIDASIPGTMRVQALGVQGFVLTYDGESIMTAPLFTRQSGIDVALNAPIAADVSAIEAGLANVDLHALRAIVTGHAHYDHLLDVTHVMTAMAPTTTLFANRTARHVFAALAPDRSSSCTTPPGAATIDRARVIAVDDPLASHVDYTNCPDQLPPGAPMDGSWVMVPNAHVRLMPVCTTHPPQIGTTHFAPGSIDTDQCDVPPAASGWLEGQTISYVIDFLDAAGAPAFRIYYQDAPATMPIGQVPAHVLAERRVDLAILCVGSNDAVLNQPTDILANLTPRFVVSGHWENFLQPSPTPIVPIPGLHVDLYTSRVMAALSAAPDVTAYVDGAPLVGRHVLARPGMDIIVPPPP
jgi:hypothetical protein